MKSLCSQSVYRGLSEVTVFSVYRGLSEVTVFSVSLQRTE